MTANTNEDPAAIEHAIASRVPPEVASTGAAGEPNLESRVKARRAKLIDKIGGLREDRRPEATESRDKLKAKLSEVTHLLKWGVAGDWANLSVPLTDKLEQWLVESTRQMITRYEQS